VGGERRGEVANRYVKDQCSRISLRPPLRCHGPPPLRPAGDDAHATGRTTSTRPRIACSLRNGPRIAKTRPAIGCREQDLLDARGRRPVNSLTPASSLHANPKASPRSVAATRWLLRRPDPRPRTATAGRDVRCDRFSSCPRAAAAPRGGPAASDRSGLSYSVTFAASRAGLSFRPPRLPGFTEPVQTRAAKSATDPWTRSS
jgi:hypothetical protein